MLDNPVDVTGNKLIGKFRSGDIRWNQKIRTIKQVLMEPEGPIMYLLDGKIGPLQIDPVAYTYNQLQKVSTREKVNEEPIVENEENRFEFEKILDRRKKGRSYEYLVKWRGYAKKFSTYEPRKALVEDLGVAKMKKVDEKFDKAKAV